MILTYLPTFCWQTQHQILTMLEQGDEDIRQNTLATMIWLLVREGKIERKAARNPHMEVGIRPNAVTRMFRLKDRSGQRA